MVGPRPVGFDSGARDGGGTGRLDAPMRHPKASRPRSSYPRGASRDVAPASPGRLARARSATAERVTWARALPALRAFPRR
jgi:hypothetical protein